MDESTYMYVHAFLAMDLHRKYTVYLFLSLIPDLLVSDIVLLISNNCPAGLSSEPY